MKKIFYVAIGILTFTSATIIGQTSRQKPPQDVCDFQEISLDGCGGGGSVCCANTRLNFG